jgi:hypothetical protein
VWLSLIQSAVVVSLGLRTTKREFIYRKLWAAVFA